MAHPLAIGRVRNEAAVAALAAELVEGTLLEMDRVGHAGLLCVVACQTERVATDVGAQDPFGDLCLSQIAGLLTGLLPRLGIERGPCLGRKRPPSDRAPAR